MATKKLSSYDGEDFLAELKEIKTTLTDSQNDLRAVRRLISRLNHILAAAEDSDMENDHKEKERVYLRAIRIYQRALMIINQNFVGE